MASRKGIPNNVGADTKQSIISVFGGLGGAEEMLRWAKRNQTEFYKILAKILPKDLDITTGAIFVKVGLTEAINAHNQSESASETIDSVH